MSYLTETEVATRQLFQALDYYNALLKAIDPPVFVGSAKKQEEFERNLEDWREKKRSEIDSSLERARAYAAKQFSRDTISGSIIQIAAMGLQLEGQPGEPPQVFAEIFDEMKKGKAKVLPFCCGREIRGVPAGLISYAARNQYNHQDEQNLNRLNTAIFDTLAYNHGVEGFEDFKEPAFDLENQHLQVYAGNAMHILGWFSYKDYRREMDLLLDP
jgi:hypothetical protein